MEPQFVCINKPTVRKMAEQSRRMQPVKTVISILLGMLFLGYVLKRAIEYNFQGVWMMFLVLGGVYLVWLVAMPEINAYLSIRRVKKQLGEYPASQMMFGDEIQLTQGEASMTWQYSDISYVKQLRHSFLLVSRDQTFVSVDPKCFTKGSFREWKQFLREQRPDLRIPE